MSLSTGIKGFFRSKNTLIIIVPVSMGLDSLPTKVIIIIYSHKIIQIMQYYKGTS